jgi:hypothetical protein
MQTTSTQPGRHGHRWRCLRESRVEVHVDLDRRGPVDVVTDLDDLSEAIAAIASGGGFALRLYSEGGPCADTRLIVEDCGYELGAALREALGPPASGIVLPRGIAVAAAGELSGVLAAAFCESLGRGLGARVEPGLPPHEAPRPDAEGFVGLGRAIGDAARQRPEDLSRR